MPRRWGNTVPEGSPCSKARDCLGLHTDQRSMHSHCGGKGLAVQGVHAGWRWRRSCTRKDERETWPCPGGGRVGGNNGDDFSPQGECDQVARVAHGWGPSVSGDRSFSVSPPDLTHRSGPRFLCARTGVLPGGATSCPDVRAVKRMTGLHSCPGLRPLAPQPPGLSQHRALVCEALQGSSHP